MVVFKLGENSIISSNQSIDQGNIDVMKKGDAMSTFTIDGELSLLRADAEAIMNLIADVEETLDKIKNPFMIKKTSQKSGYRVDVLQYNKGCI